jgi:hypothetical protein
MAGSCCPPRNERTSVINTFDRLDHIAKMLHRDRFALDIARPHGWALFSADRKKRYALGRAWDRMLGGTSRVAVLCGLNPSKADAFEPDQTISKEIGFADSWGCDELIKINLYPWISTDPAGLDEPAAAISGDDDERVAAILRFLIAPTSCSMTVVAWGAHPMATKARVGVMTTLLAELANPLLCLGTTADGSPRHPSRIAYATPLERWKGM